MEWNLSGQALTSPLLSLATVIMDFLHGRGVPCPQCLHGKHSLPHYHQLVPYWRRWLQSQTFLLGNNWNLWMEVRCTTNQGIEENDPGYSIHHFGSVMASKGKASYAMCFQTVWIPISYILKLAEASKYPDPSGKPRISLRLFTTGSFVKSWMPSALIQLLNVTLTQTENSEWANPLTCGSVCFWYAYAWCSRGPATWWGTQWRRVGGLWCRLAKCTWWAASLSSEAE